MTKRCSKCGEVKPLEEFYFQKKRGEYRTECKACTRIKNDEWKSRTPDYMKNYLKEYHIKNSKKIIERATKWGRDNLERRRNISKTSAKNQRVVLNEAYIRTCLNRRNFTPDQITPDLIAAERALIKLKRAVKGIEV